MRLAPVPPSPEACPAARCASCRRLGAAVTEAVRDLQDLLMTADLDGSALRTLHRALEGLLEAAPGRPPGGEP
ncbi:MAG: hypothetical protein HY721_16305 [Planctomycetes bacterium]|nr:hypothetical protein [Planctomycetota bacterium]